MVKISIDVDGVIADFTKGFIGALNQNAGFKMIPEDYEPKEWDWPNAIVGDEGTANGWKTVKATNNFWLGLGPLPGVVDLRNFIHDPISDQVEIYFTTARARTAGRVLAAQTRQWLETRVGWSPNWNIITVEDGLKKPQVFDAIGIKYSIDDYDKTVRATREALQPGWSNHEAFLIDQSWNRDAHDLDHVRVYSVGEYLNILKEKENLK